MVKKSKKQPDDRSEENEFVEIPDDRLEQLEQSETDQSQTEAEEKPRRKSSTRRKPKQAPIPEEAPEKEKGPEESLGKDPEAEELPEKESEKPELSREDLLADVRQALIAEEVVEEPKGFFGRIRARLKKTPKPQEKETDTQALTEPQEKEIDTQALPGSLLETRADLVPSVIEPEQKKKEPSKNREEEKAIQEFFADLEALADIEVEEYVPPEPEPREEIPSEVEEGEGAQVPRLPVKSKEDEVDFDVIRETALEEYDETKIEVEERKPQLREEVQQTIRESRPFERFLLVGAGVLTVLILLSSGIFLIVNSISVPTPMPTATIDLADIVHPTQLTLPGGWEFNLGQGQVADGEWRPRRAEWLVGTEISRWVALPWSLQLEAVLRTLKPEDQLELTMSNFEVLDFNVYSIRELTMEQLLASDPLTPSLLVVLYNDEEPDGKYWVVEARP